MKNDTALIFDLDGTLVDAFADIAAAVNAPLKTRGLPLHSVETIKSMVGDGVGKLLDRAAPNLPPDDAAAYRREMMEYYYDHPADSACLYDGVHELLGALQQQGVPLAVLSNKPQPMTIKTCQHVGIDKYFTLIFGEDSARRPRKPDPGGVHEVLRETGAKSAIMIGDGIPDAQVAHAAGIPFIGVLWGSRLRAELEAHKPRAVAANVPELGEILKGILGS